jgi:LCP family protein required for cell wall assembly
MNETLVKYRELLLIVLILIGVILFGFALQGCQYEAPTTGDNTHWVTEVGVSSTIPETAANQNQDQSQDENPAPEPDQDDQPFGLAFPPPAFDPATPIPPPLEGLALDENILVWVLLGSDTEPPFTGRTNAIHLLFINPRFSKASLVSIPGDLYVYIPGYTMQRLNIAYTIGGIETLRMTLAYNFGVNPSRFVLAHPGDFQWLVDDINGIEVTVFLPMPNACGGIRAGVIQMDGNLALCYASYREGMDEVDRMLRQQQLLRLIFQKFSRDGNLIKLPILYTSYTGWIRTDFSLPELMGYIPLALRLADPDRVGYYLIGWDQISIWEVPGYSQAMVFLPDQEGVKAVIQSAIDAIMSPSPLTNQVQTLEAQLTAAHQATGTAFSQVTPTPTITPTPAGTEVATDTWETPFPTPTITPPGYP